MAHSNNVQGLISQILQHDLDTPQSWESRNKMEFHPGKCTVLRFSLKQKPTLFTYKIHGVNLQTQNSAKYLGVTLDSKLDWNEHCDSIYNKACFMLAFLERNVHKCPRHVKENCFNALVRPLVEYACCVWDPHKQTQIDKLEKINKRATKFITRNLIFAHGNTERNFSLLGWSTLQARRAKLKVTMLYKIRNDLIRISKKDLIPATSSRYRLNYAVPHSKLERHLHSFSPAPSI